MPRFVTIGYGDEAGYDRTPAPVRDAAHAHDAGLQSKGTPMGRAGRAVQVRNPSGQGVQTTDGPFLAAPLPLVGFALIEAESLDEAIEIASHSPCAVAHGVIEVWPLEEDS